VDELYEFQVYESKDGGWRWRLKAPNARIVADSGESYADKDNAIRAAENVQMQISEAAVFEVEEELSHERS
jgi:uncharacterized protein